MCVCFREVGSLWLRLVSYCVNRPMMGGYIDKKVQNAACCVVVTAQSYGECRLCAYFSPNLTKVLFNIYLIKVLFNLLII